MKMQSAITVNLECAHYDILSRRLHGHSYLVEVWFEAGPNLDVAKLAISEITNLIDHTCLDESVGGPNMEDIAKWVFERVSLIGTANLKITKVVVKRPTLGFIVEMRALARAALGETE